MKLNQLNIGAGKSRKRIGRGIGSGHGKTAGRGTKGQRSRSGSKLRPSFEGGQNPLVHRLPKQRGFRSRRPAVQLIKTGQLNRLTTTKLLKVEDLQAAGLVERINVPVRLVAGGAVKKTVKLEIQGVSSNAKKLVKAAGGTITIREMQSQPARSKTGAKAL